MHIAAPASFNLAFDSAISQGEHVSIVSSIDAEAHRRINANNHLHQRSEPWDHHNHQRHQCDDRNCGGVTHAEHVYRDTSLSSSLRDSLPELSIESLFRADQKQQLSHIELRQLSDSAHLKDFNVHNASPEFNLGCIFKEDRQVLSNPDSATPDDQHKVEEQLCEQERRDAHHKYGSALILPSTESSHKFYTAHEAASPNMSIDLGALFSGEFAKSDQHEHKETLLKTPIPAVKSQGGAQVTESHAGPALPELNLGSPLLVEQDKESSVQLTGHKTSSSCYSRTNDKTSAQSSIFNISRPAAQTLRTQPAECALGLHPRAEHISSLADVNLPQPQFQYQSQIQPRPRGTSKQVTKASIPLKKMTWFGVEPPVKSKSKSKSKELHPLAPAFNFREIKKVQLERLKDLRTNYTTKEYNSSAIKSIQQQGVHLLNFEHADSVDRGVGSAFASAFASPLKTWPGHFPRTTGHRSSTCHHKTSINPTEDIFTAADEPHIYTGATLELGQHHRRNFQFEGLSQTSLQLKKYPPRRTNVINWHRMELSVGSGAQFQYFPWDQ
ncbi:hypothetical protein BGX27_006691 [Mortierella sp. AM989]|nr:hypothetical protein BGX27_006691 [Mortierella sp. AM989]